MRLIKRDTRGVRIAVVNYDHDVDLREPEELLERYRTLVDWGDGLVAAGAEVTIVQGFTRDASLRRGGVAYELVSGPFAPRLARFRVPGPLHRRVAEAMPDLVHLNGLGFPIQARALRRGLRLPLVIQHHAEGPSKRFSSLQRWGLAAADGFLFTAEAQAQEWRAKGLLRPGQPVYEVIEGTSRLRCRDRREARGRSGLAGDPVLLWVGHLDANKDPLSVLDGFRSALPSVPSARLYMVYRSAPLLEQVRARLASDRDLEQAVELLGPRPYAAMEDLFNSADLFVLGSHREGSGYALLDALACGVVPVVPDIPSFRRIVGDGPGELWPAGSAAGFAAALTTVAGVDREALRRSTRRHFESRLGVEALGRGALAAYRDVLRRQGRARS